MFESLGKLFFSKLRLPFFSFFLLIPFLLCFFSLYIKWTYLEEVEESFSLTKTRAKAAFDKKRRKEQFLERFLGADPFFLDHQIEAFLPLGREVTLLESLLHHPALSEKKGLKERLTFLLSGENRLRFREEEIQTTGRMKETVEKQLHPIQMEEADLKKVLSLLENMPIDSYLPDPRSPQFLITDLLIEKKKTELHTDVLEVEIEILKREFIHP